MGADHRTHRDPLFVTDYNCLSGPVCDCSVTGQRHGGGQKVLTETQTELLVSAGTYLVLNVFYINPLKIIVYIFIAINP